MFKRFFPDVALESFEQITEDFLAQRGIKGLILDIDNTLVPYNTKIPDARAHKWFELMKNAGIRICIMSNAREARVRLFNEGLDFPAIHKAGKPGKGNFSRVVTEMGFKPGEIAMVGDQVFTDIWGGKRSGLYTILVKPIDKKENIFIKSKRLLELPILYFYDLSNKKKDV